MTPEGGRLLTVAVVLLVAVAAAVIFLDSRIATLEQEWQKGMDAAVERQRSDSEVLMGLDGKIDRVAQRSDLDEVLTRTGAASASIDALQAGSDKRLDALQQEVHELRRQVQAAAERDVDYRPLFEDLRERHQRALAAIDALRAVAAAAPVAVPQPPVEAPPQQAAPAEGLPAELAEQVKKLTAADPAVRFEAVDLLVASKNPLVLSHVLPLVRDPDSYVRRLTVEGLRAFAKPDAVDALLGALADEDENVRDTAWRSLREVTGQKLPFEASGSKDARARAIQRWQDWWDKARATFGS